MSSWFEDTEATREIIATGRTNRGIKNKLRKYLETRRDIWARRFLQTALMFRDSEQILGVENPNRIRTRFDEGSQAESHSFDGKHYAHDN